MQTDRRKLISALVGAAVCASLLSSCSSAKTGEDAPVTATSETADSGETLPPSPITSTEAAPTETPESATSYGETVSAPSDESTAPTVEASTAETPADDDAPPVAAQPLTLEAGELCEYSIGRTLLSDDVLYMNHTCSGLRFDFRGSSLKADFVSSAEYCYDDEHRAWIAVYLGDSTEPCTRFPLDSEQAEYTLLESDEPISSTVTVVKLTEEQFGTAGITSLRLGAGASIGKIPDSDRYIEFFGDSITAGYGNEGELSHGFDTSEENGMLTYAPITARALGADFSMVCVSGMGLTASRTCDFVAGDIYPKTDAFISDAAYDFTRKPQLIVVNLGANDSYYINKDSSVYDLYESRYYDLLAQIRSCNPDSVILCCICDYWQERMPQIERVVKQFSEDNGDDGIYTLLLPYVTREEDYGSDAHPKIKVQYEIADVLTEKIKELGIF